MTAVVDAVKCGDGYSFVPSVAQKFFATDGVVRGYGYGAGPAIIFDTPKGAVSVNPGQWIGRTADGDFVVSDDDLRP